MVEQLVGPEFFRRLALAYMADHPSVSGNLHEYGHGMASFISSFRPAQCLPYLHDVAMLEWACHRAYFAEDTQEADLATLARLSPDQYAHLVLHLSPTCHLIQSDYPVAIIWRAHQPGMPADFHINLEGHPCHLLVTRHDDEVVVVEIPAMEACWIKLIQSGMTLGEATVSIPNQSSDFDLQSALCRLATHGLLTGFHLKEFQ